MRLIEARQQLGVCTHHGNLVLSPTLDKMVNRFEQLSLHTANIKHQARQRPDDQQMVSDCKVARRQCFPVCVWKGRALTLMRTRQRPSFQESPRKQERRVDLEGAVDWEGEPLPAAPAAATAAATSGFPMSPAASAWLASGMPAGPVVLTESAADAHCMSSGAEAGGAPLGHELDTGGWGSQVYTCGSGSR
jgi:hypothetical protein